MKKTMVIILVAMAFSAPVTAELNDLEYLEYHGRQADETNRRASEDLIRRIEAENERQEVQFQLDQLRGELDSLKRHSYEYDQLHR